MKITDYLPSSLFKNKTVFVTGGGSGINLGIAKNFAAVGANLSICGRTEEKLNLAAEELRALGAQVHTQCADVRNYDQLQTAIEQTQKNLGPIDVLVCGAAGNFPCPAEAMSPNGFKSVIDIDLLGAFNTSRAAFEQLKATRGCVIFISAGQAMIPYALQAHVGAAKAGIDNLMQNLALEWGRYGIRSNSVVPGPIEGTEGMKRLAPGDLGEKLVKTIPLGRFGNLDDIGQTCVFLASPMATYITGSRIVVDGGQNLPGSGEFFSIMMDAMKGA